MSKKSSAACDTGELLIGPLQEPSEGSYRHRGVRATWKQRSVQLELTVTQNHYFGKRPVHTLWEVMNMENSELLALLRSPIPQLIENWKE